MHESCLLRKLTHLVYGILRIKYYHMNYILIKCIRCFCLLQSNEIKFFCTDRQVSVRDIWMHLNIYNPKCFLCICHLIMPDFDKMWSVPVTCGFCLQRASSGESAQCHDVITIPTQRILCLKKQELGLNNDFDSELLCYLPRKKYFIIIYPFNKGHAQKGISINIFTTHVYISIIE